MSEHCSVTAITIVDMRDEYGRLLLSDVNRDGWHSMVVVSIFQMLGTHLCSTNCMYMGIADCWMVLSVGAITKDQFGEALE